MSMAGYTYDDGSTISYDTSNGAVSSTQSPPGYLISDYASNFSPGNLSAGASSVMDVLKYGFGRVVDYTTASIQAANTPPTYAPLPVYAGQPLSLNGGTLLLIGGVVLLVMLMGGDGNKG